MFFDLYMLHLQHRYVASHRFCSARTVQVDIIYGFQIVSPRGNSVPDGNFLVDGFEARSIGSSPGLF